MFGISFGELMLILVVAVVVVGPQKLPQMLGTVGKYMGKLRRITTEMRRQTGIDEILRSEGLPGGINELRNMMRGENIAATRDGHRRSPVAADPYDDYVEYDRTREYPVEGPDAYGAIPEDLAGDVRDDLGPDAEDAEPLPNSPSESTAASAEDKPAESKASA